MAADDATNDGVQRGDYNIAVMMQTLLPAWRTMRGALVLPGARATRTLGTTVAVLGLGMVTSILLAHWLGPSGRGGVAAALLWPTLLIYLASFGLIHSILYHGAQAELDPGDIYGTGLLLAMLQSIPALLIGYFALPMLLHAQGADVIAAARLCLLIVPMSLVAQYAISLVQARMHFDAFNTLRLIIPVGFFLGLVGLRSTGAITVRNVVLLQVVLNGLTMIGALITIAQLRIVTKLAVDRALARRLLRYGGKVWAGGLSQAANLRLDQALLSGLFPPAALGIYVTATSVSNLLSVLANSVQMIVTPTVANRTVAAERKSELVRLFRRFWLVNIMGGLALAAISPILVPLLFGKAFAAAVLPAVILIAGALFIGAKDVLAGGAQALGDPWLGSRSEIVAMGVTVVLLLALLPTLGIIGAAIASTLAYFTQFAVVVHGLSKRHGIPARTLTGLSGTP